MEETYLQDSGNYKEDRENERTRKKEQLWDTLNKIFLFNKRKTIGCMNKSVFKG